MNIDTMSVNVTDRSISINGEGYICAPEYFPEVDSNIISMQWHPKAQGRCSGSVSKHVGGGEGINDFALLEPFVPAWWKARETKLTNNALVEAECHGAFDEPVVVEETADTDLPRFLTQNQQPNVSDEMLKRAEEFEQRAREAVERAQKSIESSKEDSSRIKALEDRLSALENALREAMKSKGDTDGTQ